MRVRLTCWLGARPRVGRFPNGGTSHLQTSLWHPPSPTAAHRRPMACSSCLKIVKDRSQRSYEINGSCDTNGACALYAAVEHATAAHHCCSSDFCNGASGLRRGPAGWATAQALLLPPAALACWLLAQCW